MIEDSLMTMVAGSDRLKQTTFNTVLAKQVRQFMFSVHQSYRRTSLRHSWPLVGEDWDNIACVEFLPKHVTVAKATTVGLLCEGLLESLTTEMALLASYLQQHRPRNERRTGNRLMGVFCIERRGLDFVLDGKSPWGGPA